MVSQRKSTAYLPPSQALLTRPSVAFLVFPLPSSHTSTPLKSHLTSVSKVMQYEQLPSMHASSPSFVPYPARIHPSSPTASSASSTCGTVTVVPMPSAPSNSNNRSSSLPAACAASLLSLRSSCPLPAPPSASSISVASTTHRSRPPRSADRFWATVMASSSTSAADARSSSASEHSGHHAMRQTSSPRPNRSDRATSDEICKMNIPCVVCGVRFRKPGHLNMHWRSVHATSSNSVYPAAMDARVTAGGTNPQRVMAPLPPTSGGRVVKSPTTLPVAGQSRAYGCPQCEARFRRGSDRNRHMRMVHAKIRPYKCKQCGNRFGRKSFLDAHVLTVHEKRRPFLCECGTAFGQRSSLTRHTRKIHGREP